MAPPNKSRQLSHLCSRVMGRVPKSESASTWGRDEPGQGFRSRGGATTTPTPTSSPIPYHCDDPERLRLRLPITSPGVVGAVATTPGDSDSDSETLARTSNGESESGSESPGLVSMTRNRNESRNRNWNRGSDVPRHLTENCRKFNHVLDLNPQPLHCEARHAIHSATFRGGTSARR